MDKGRQTLARVSLAVAVIAALVVTWRHRDLFDRQHLQSLLGNSRGSIADNPYAPLLFILLHIVVSLTFIPRTVMAIAAGLIWGLWWGTLLATLGGLAGASAGFLIARYLNNGFIQPERIPRFGRLLERLEEGGWRAVTLVRLIPVMPHTPVNYALGLTQIGFIPYCLGTILGSLPMTVFYVDLSDAGAHAITTHGQWIMPTVIGLAALGLSLLVPRLPGLRASKD